MTPKLIYPRRLPSLSSCSTSYSWLWAKLTKANRSESRSMTRSALKWESRFSDKRTTSSRRSQRGIGKSSTRSTRVMTTSTFWTAIWSTCPGTQTRAPADRMNSRIVTTSLIWNLTIIRDFPIMTKKPPRRSSPVLTHIMIRRAPFQVWLPLAVSIMILHRLGRRSRNCKSKSNRKTTSLDLWHFWYYP